MLGVSNLLSRDNTKMMWSLFIGDDQNNQLRKMLWIPMNKLYTIFILSLSKRFDTHNISQRESYTNLQLHNCLKRLLPYVPHKKVNIWKCKVVEYISIYLWLQSNCCNCISNPCDLITLFVLYSHIIFSL